MRNPLPDRMTLTNERAPAGRYESFLKRKLELYKEGYAFPSEQREFGTIKEAVHEIGFETIEEFVDSDINMGIFGYEGEDVEGFIWEAWTGGHIGIVDFEPGGVGI